MADFKYTDLHCHPNLKTFGHSFSNQDHPKADVWFTKKPDFFTRKIYEKTGLTKFSQTDLSTMTRAKGKIAFVSLYPFEKGFFHNPYVSPPLAAQLANWGIEIGYNRIRHIQKHSSYFEDLKREYLFFIHSRQKSMVDDVLQAWSPLKDTADLTHNLNTENEIAVIFSIEGAHVFNTGLEEYGIQLDREEVFTNISMVKNWEFPPLFIGLAHNFNNDLCGHARSLQRLGKLVNQEKNLGIGLTHLGSEVVRELLDKRSGRRILIDLKHMSLATRMDYFRLLEEEFPGESIPLIVSHGALTGRPIRGNGIASPLSNIFNATELNFYDEEIVKLVESKGLFAFQMDLNIHVDIKKIKGLFRFKNPIEDLQNSALLIWNQLQHFAEVCDRNGLFAWGNTCLGTDFDGSIYPFPGILTAEGLEPLSLELKNLAGSYLKKRRLTRRGNYEIQAEEIVERFFFTNTVQFLYGNF
ncbi:membrane dipeptidase [Rhodonellum sp.]|uniref:membrane dipeptidase n=1 Tax=Rhodonellum sp. TaxID=2231180 RepID=UPI0027284542|nr:membrane dipeptidase [Rhodonellum sp.]MDO9554884.1 membrane dipeptidase [Rhodonellum sp.]